MEFLGIDLRFSSRTIEWEGRSIDFKEITATPEDSFFINDPKSVVSEMDRIKKILDAKYEKADLSKVAIKKQATKQG